VEAHIDMDLMLVWLSTGDYAAQLYENKASTIYQEGAEESLPNRFVGDAELEARVRRYAKLSELEKFVDEFRCLYLSSGSFGRLILTQDHLVWFDRFPVSLW
jgi:hypothetical protein